MSRFSAQSLNDNFENLDFAFDAGGMIRAAMNEGKSTPLNVRIRGKDMVKTRDVAAAIEREVESIPGVVDARIVQRLDYPEFMIDIDRAKAADLGLSQADVIQNVVAALNSSIQFNKKNFWIDPVSHNQYFVGVQYPESDIRSVETLLNIPITAPTQPNSVPLRNVAKIVRTQVPAEVNHTTLQATIDLTMGVSGRDLGHVADDVARVMDRFGKLDSRGVWEPYEVDKNHQPILLSQQSKSASVPAETKSTGAAASKYKLLVGGKMELVGEYSRMQDTFINLSIGLILASLLMYFLMVALDKSWVVPFTVMFTVPLSQAGVIPMLYLTGTALNVQSLLGIIFIIGIKVANTVLLSDLRRNFAATKDSLPRRRFAKRPRSACGPSR